MNRNFGVVVVVALLESQNPYIYDSLIQSKNWKPDHLKLLWKENATRGDIFNSLDWLIENADDDDIVLFSVDCHGTYQKDEEDGLDEYLMVYDSDRILFSKNWINYSYSI
ncbi:Caspase domain-containing protein [Thermoplasmatales archaeon SCGC AB-539-C06]|nr:Caspase domain-containing protein [Thermoplasmatales archaeon SCGC AB-539-C06]